MGNSRYLSGLYLTHKLEIHGPLLDGGRESFGFVRTDVYDTGSIKPSNANKQMQVSYPCMVYRAPHPQGNKVFVETLYSPEKVRILDLGEWTYICGLETVKGEDKGHV